MLWTCHAVARIDDLLRCSGLALAAINHAARRILDPVQINQRLRPGHAALGKHRHRPHRLFHRDFLEAHRKARQQLGFLQRQTERDTGIHDPLQARLARRTEPWPRSLIAPTPRGPGSSPHKPARKPPSPIRREFPPDRRPSPPGCPSAHPPPASPASGSPLSPAA